MSEIEPQDVSVETQYHTRDTQYLFTPSVSDALRQLRNKGAVAACDNQIFRKHDLDYLDKLYVDTVCYHPEALECCYRLLGAERLLYGTDHPFAAFDLAASMVERLDCSEAERELIYHGNAERLFGRKF